MKRPDDIENAAYSAGRPRPSKKYERFGEIIRLKLRAFVEGLAGSESTQVAPPVHDDVSGSLNKP